MQILNEFVSTLSRLPGIGRKNAQRLAYYFLECDRNFLQQLTQQMLSFHQIVHSCTICGCYTDSTNCQYCHDMQRDHSLICVVAHPQDVESIESSQSFKGLYHVLGGVLAPLDGIGPEDLHIDGLVKRIKNSNIKEVILATNLDTEGDATALYLQKILSSLAIKITRIASGLPVGTSLEFVDSQTLGRSLRGRSSLE